MKKALFNTLGVIFVGFGIIGVFLPIWPTTPFVLAASIFFAKANPKLHAWLLRSRFLGPYLENYYYKRGIPLAYKIRTCAFLWSGLAFSMTLISYVWLMVLLCAVGIAVSAHVFAIKTKDCETGWGYSLVTCALVWGWLILAMFFAPSIWLYVSLGTAFTVFMIGFEIFRQEKRY